ncbi:hypothetical protein D0Z07_8170 [Hyphodiscus hymeniophilus]|uniref:Uncharacterized protein n=1 Tax=Hyphodiscus hymeniophilus TaxID=353542 RepID=A0A9P6SM45_9HELO|nr:hypothetical protein D0Z07_8170 [Hyphodiscus hymeniophilus]
MSDDEMDREWKPSARPQSHALPHELQTFHELTAHSTMARSFSLALNDLFKIDNSLADLDAAVSEKKKAVSSQTSELEALEARLRATEERLKAAASNKSPSGRSSPKARTPLGDTFAQSPTRATNIASPLASEIQKPVSRPVTANRPKTGDGRPPSQWRGDVPPMPGQLPPTPGASEGESSASENEYVLVGRRRNSADLGLKDGDVPNPTRNQD